MQEQRTYYLSDQQLAEAMIVTSVDPLSPAAQSLARSLIAGGFDRYPASDDLFVLARYLRAAADLGASHALTARRSSAVDALERLNQLVDGVDNGYCRLCGANRLHDLDGKLRPCEGYACVSHAVRQVLHPSA